MPAALRYTLSLLRPRTHLVDVELEVRGLSAGPFDLAMPAWTPGSYKIRDFARNVQELAAADARGRRLAATKRDKGTWRIERGAAEGGTVRVRYRVYANDLSVRTSHVDEDHAWLCGAGLFFYIAGRPELPATVRVRAPRGWRTATALPPAPGGGGFAAADYDTLVDSPLEVGRFELHEFAVRGRPHRLAIHGAGNHDPKRIVADLRKIAEAEAELFGGLPYADYLFVLHLHPEGGGGLEHRACCALQFPRFGFRPRDKYEGFLSLCAHELFHLWNGKRIRPAVLGPFGYQQEAYTRALWVVEGITSYYDKLILLRAGLIDAPAYLKKCAEAVQRLLETPGRLVQPVDEAGFDAWIRLYQAHEHTPNCTVSYYEKGQVVGWLLDLKLRALTRGRRSLDDVMRLLWNEYGKPDRGYEEEAVRAAAERVAGRDLGAFFAEQVSGTRDPDWNAYLRPFGLAWTSTAAGSPKPWLGARVEKKGETGTVAGVAPGGPAELDGLAAGDEIVALDGYRVNGEGWEKRLEDLAPGACAVLTVFRKDELRAVPVTVGERAAAAGAIVRRAGAGAAARRLRRGWLGATDGV
ncbi:MAG: M61 family metallopeptidase [Planctomycetes bacterium]|nr:M61 family metallopeptidase [Planctomycetota bacterium]